MGLVDRGLQLDKRFVDWLGVLYSRISFAQAWDGIHFVVGSITLGLGLMGFYMGFRALGIVWTVYGFWCFLVGGRLLRGEDG